MKNEKFVVIQFPFEEYDVCRAQDIFEAISTRVANVAGMETIMIPSDYTWNTLTKEQLLEIRNTIDIILESKDDSYSKARARIEDSDREI